MTYYEHIGEKHFIICRSQATETFLTFCNKKDCCECVAKNHKRTIPRNKELIYAWSGKILPFFKEIKCR